MHPMSDEYTIHMKTFFITPHPGHSHKHASSMVFFAKEHESDEKIISFFMVGHYVLVN